MAKNLAGNKVFMGLFVKDNPLVIPKNNTPDCENIRIDNPIGALNNEIGKEKQASSGYNADVTAIHQLLPMGVYGGNIVHTVAPQSGYRNWSSWNGETLDNPSGIFVYQGEVYVCDGSNDRIVIFDLMGNYKRTWGSGGSGDGEFDIPLGICIYNNEAYVVDTHNHRIQVFDLDGNFDRKWGSQGSGDGQFENPAGSGSLRRGSSSLRSALRTYRRHRVRGHQQPPSPTPFVPAGE